MIFFATMFDKQIGPLMERREAEVAARNRTWSAAALSYLATELKIRSAAVTYLALDASNRDQFQPI